MPETCSFSDGFDSPIPTFPAEVIRIRSVAPFVEEAEVRNTTDEWLSAEVDSFLKSIEAQALGPPLYALTAVRRPILTLSVDEYPLHLKIPLPDPVNVLGPDSS